MTAVQVVWFKRDMRVHDHAPLMQALQQRHTLGPVLCVYCIEPTLWQQPDAARQHYHFALECLADLRVQLHSLGLALHVLHGEVTSVLDALQARGGISHLWSHTETGNNASYSRDKAVAAWCARARVAWTEVAQFGVKRGLRARVGSSWAQHWQRHMATPCASVAAFTTRVQAVPVLGGGHGGHGGDGGYFMDVAHEAHEAHKANKVHGVHGAYATLGLPSAWYQQPSADALGLDPHEPHARQRGGRAAAMALLQSFIAQRSGWYRGGISSPLTAPDACSRLSPYLSMGCVSMREVVQTIEQARLNPDTPARHRQGLTAMLSRLHWHCHFIQKLETEPAIEWRNMHSGYNGLREHDWNPAHFEALKNGQTGWPMVDASVAMLKATGWINFRMRAMLVSVAAYPLWLHWRDVGTWLATQFLDYEPGIHWSQMQMQSGTTGINTTRVYNPIKQAQDH
ncbi:MAG: deoxyribodipyrimidine photo-lyase, partial [Burkholderiaceae bacterium]|nr:deoxyribodipyrimidine photo-lyase [Burkholderiaceae bacterium]